MSHSDNGKPSLLTLMKTAVEAHQSLGARPPDAAIPDAVPVRKVDTLNMTNNQGRRCTELVLMKKNGCPHHADILRADKISRRSD
jgi:hypothetical protein